MSNDQTISKKTNPFEPYRPIEKRYTAFEHRPTEQQLGTDLGYGLMGSSNRKLTEDDDWLRFVPQAIPIVFAVVCMGIPLFCFLVCLIIFDVQDRSAWAMVIGSVFIIPVMMALLSWLNAMEGDEPFLVFDKSTETLLLPRVAMSFQKEQIREIIFLERFVQGNIHWQVSLLVEEQPDQWKYVHMFNEAGTGSGMQWLGMKDTYQKIAASLGVESRRLKFSKTESQTLS